MTKTARPRRNAKSPVKGAARRAARRVIARHKRQQLATAAFNSPLLRGLTVVAVGASADEAP